MHNVMRKRLAQPAHPPELMAYKSLTGSGQAQHIVQSETKTALRLIETWLTMTKHGSEVEPQVPVFCLSIRMSIWTL